ncbi:MAG: CYTH domain-containing protein [bacterium]|nr:CYTH domain-containing protein [bacterium]
MEIEYEATFENIDKEEMRKKLREAGAALVRPEFIQKRKVFKLPKGNEIPGGWLRVRDEGDRITMTLKVVDGEKIENQKETTIEVSSFVKAQELLTSIGCFEKGYQESKRELWKIGETEVTIDEWPFLEPFAEVEARSEKEVIQVSEKLGFDYTEALFCAVDTLYARKYGVSKDIIDNKIPKLVFEMENPFI